MRLIDADALIKERTEEMWQDNCDHTVVRVTNIENAPTIDDVEVVRHGKWVYHESVSSYDGLKSGYACSVCSGFVNEDIFDMDEFNKAFCGACGAKMDGKDGAENEST